MRKLWVLLLTSTLAMFFLVLGSPSANAFGAEVLGCGVDNYAWTANSCSGGGDAGVSNVIHFSPVNLSGSYSEHWTVVNKFGTTVTAPCTGTLFSNCIYGGCTASSLTCDIGARSAATEKTFTATLTLTQSGQTRTIQAVGYIAADQGLGCPSTGCQ